MKLIPSLLLTLGLCLSAKAIVYTNVVNPPATVSLAWDTYPDTNDTINLYLGDATRHYTNKVNIGYTNFTVVTLPARGVKFYFTITANDRVGLESQFANEVTYTATAPPATPTGVLPPVVLQVLYKNSLDDFMWADSGMAWSVDPTGTNKWFKLAIAQGGTSLPQVQTIQNPPIPGPLILTLPPK